MDYGKMYVVNVDAGISLEWTHLGGQSAPFQPILAESFTFEEKAAYQAVEIESIESEDTIIEIGAFKDGICVGAAAVFEYPIHLMVYDETTPELLDYQVVTASKGAGSDYQMLLSKNVSVVDQVIRNNVPEFSVLNLGLKPSGVDATIPQLKTSVYPNPFRNSTSIRLESAKEAQVKVSVYNSKGEKVSELYNGTLTKGNHDLVWDGKNSAGNRLAQGIYFYRVESGSKTLTRKLLMIK